MRSITRFASLLIVTAALLVLSGCCATAGKRGGLSQGRPMVFEIRRGIGEQVVSGVVMDIDDPTSGLIVFDPVDPPTSNDNWHMVGPWEPGSPPVTLCWMFEGEIANAMLAWWDVTIDNRTEMAQCPPPPPTPHGDWQHE